MNEPRRILDDSAGDLGVALVCAARNETPPDSAKRRTLTAVGLAAGTTALAAGSGLASTKVAGALPLSLVGKWTVVGVLVAGGAVGAATVVESIATRQEPSNVTLSVTTAQPSPSAAVAEEREAEDDFLEMDEPAPATMVKRPAPLAKPTSAVSAPAVSSSSSPDRSSSLAAELALVEGARRALRSGRASDALRLLDRRDTEHPRGALAMETTVLRVEALVQRGEHGRASAMGRDFLARHPNNPLAPRVRAAIGSSGNQREEP